MDRITHSIMIRNMIMDMIRDRNIFRLKVRI
jgi:hypothetical protein